MGKLSVTLQPSNIGVNAVGPTQTAILNVKDIVIASTVDPKLIISTDPNNDLKLGSDNKLMVATDELNTSFEYASSVSTFWSI